MTGTDERAVLLVAPTAERARRLGSTLAAERDTLAVEFESETTEARDRLAWPDIDCLVCVPTHADDTILPFVDEIRETHPILPIVVYGDQHVDTGSDDRLSAVEAAGPDSIPVLADHVEARLDARDSQRDTYEFDDEASAATYPNVDEARLDQLLDGGMDRDRLREMYHRSQLFEEILEKLPAHLYVKDAAGRHRYISTAYFGEEMDEFLDQADPEIGLVASDHAWRAFEEDMHVIEEGEAIVDKEEYLKRLDQWNLSSKVPWHDADGETVGLIGVTRDISRWKEREQALRRQNDRLAAFSELVSHDLRNPLQVARSALTLAQDDCESPHLDAVENAHERMDEMIADVLTLAKYGQTVIDPEEYNLEAAVREAWDTVGDDRGSLAIEGALGTVPCDPAHLKRLLENLFRNALEHGAGEDGTVTVTVEPIERPWPNHPEGDPRRGFAVADDGPGLPSADRDRLLEPGFTRATDGTGFGLAIVEEIVDVHDWTLEVTDSESGGARFEILDVERTA